MRDKPYALIVGLLLSTAVSAAPPTPEEFLGHPVGAERKLASYAQVLSYLRQVAVTSDRVSIDELGESTLGNENSCLPARMKRLCGCGSLVRSSPITCPSWGASENVSRMRNPSRT